MKKIINISIYVVAIITVLLFLFYMFAPRDWANKAVKNKDSVLCKLPIKIEGKSLEPVINRGDIIIFNKCFDIQDLKQDTPIVFRENSVNTVVLIKEISENNISIYQPNKDKIFSPINIEDIIAIYYEEENPISPIKKELEKVEFQNALVLVPQNWQVSQKENNSLVIQNLQEEDFKTYFQVYTEDIGNKLLLDYLPEFKSKIKQLAPEISFTKEDILDINDNSFYIIESTLSQQDKEFFVMFALLKNQNKVFIFSFNSLDILKQDNSVTFRQVLDNFYFIK